MSILSAFNISLSFGARDLFQGISVNVSNNSKIGLIGPNGIGKTSMLLVLAGLHPPKTGNVHLARGKRLGYLRQESITAFADRSSSVYAEMLAVFSNLQARESRLHELEALMAAGNTRPELMQQYGQLQEDFERAGGYDYDVRIQQTLEGLGLGNLYWQIPLNHLSGGQQTRALLARLLLEQPDLLVLDEPTNHLDIEAITWLEQTLQVWTGAVLMVSHDRYFLDSTVNTIWEMSSTGIEEYHGNYTTYLSQRLERWEETQTVFNAEKARLLNEIDYIQRNMVRASTHEQAIGRLRRLTRDLVIIDHYGVKALRSGIPWLVWTRNYGLKSDRPLSVSEAVRRVNALALPAERPVAIRPRLTQTHLSGVTVLQASDVLIGYPQNPLFAIDQLELKRGECAALIGPNGAGKSTFLKVLLQQMRPLEGQIQVDANVKIGYFAQAQDGLKNDQRVIDEIIRHKPMSPEQARSYLALYLFRGEEVFKPVGVLSGGERARLAFAILALDGANLLLLDEPTNHLDIPAREALQTFLETYDGTILLVSHDRYLIDRLATQIWEVRDRQLKIFKGSYREFILNQGNAGSASPSHHVMLPCSKSTVRENSLDARNRTQTLEKLEEHIHAQEETLKRLSVELQHLSSKEFDRAQQLSLAIAQAQARLESLMAEWERIVA